MKKLLIVSHAYLRNDIYSSLKYFNTKMNTICIAPRKYNLFFFKKNKKYLPLIDSFFFRKKFLFNNLKIVKNFNPNYILIEYNPWSLVFIQILIFCIKHKINTKIIIHIKDNRFSKFLFIKKFLFNILKKKINCLLFASKNSKVNFEKNFKFDNKKLFIPIHPIDTNFFKKKNKKRNQKIIFGFVGRPDKNKGLYILINALKKIYKKNFYFKILLPENKFWMNKEQTIFEDTKKIDYIKIYQNKFSKYNVIKFYRSIDIIICPTIENNFYAEQDGQVALENLSLNNIVVVSNSGFFKNLDNKIGLIKVNKMNPKNLSNKLNLIIKNYKKINKFINNRKYIINNYSLKSVIKKKIEIFNSI